MNSLPSIELHKTYIEQDSTSINPNLSQHNTVLTDRTFQHLPDRSKASASHFSLPVKVRKETANSHSVTTADTTEFRSSLQEYTHGSHIQPPINVLHFEPSQVISDHDESQEKSMSMIQPENNQDIPMINVESVIPSNLNMENNNNNHNHDQVIPIIEVAPAPVLITAEPVVPANTEALQQPRVALEQLMQFYILMGSTYLMAFLCLNGQLPYLALLIFFSLVCSVKIITNLSFIELNERYHRALDWISLSMIAFSSLIRSFVPDLPLIPFVFPGFLCTLLFWKIAQPRPFYLKKEHLVILRFLFWTQLLLITLKIDGYVNSWSFVFLMLFYFFVFIMSFSVGVFIVAVVYLIQTLRLRSLDHTIISLVWIFLNTLFAWIWGFCTLHLINTLEGHPHTLFFKACLLVGFIHAITITIYTRVFKNTLATRLEDTIGRNEGDAPRTQSYVFESATENIAYLVRVSSTYFTTMDEGFKMQDKQQAVQWKQKIIDAKMRKYRVYSLKLDNKEIKKLDLHGRQEENSITPSSKDNSLYERKIKRRNSHIYLYDKEATDFSSKILCYSQNDIDIIKEIKRPSLKNGKSEEGGDENQCVVCFSAPSSAVFMDCGHGGVCYDCALEVWRRGDKCAFCREDIKKILKVEYVPGLDVARVIAGITKTVVFE